MTETRVLPVFPFDSDPREGIYPDFARWRGDDPVPVVRLASGGIAYLATRYDDVRRVYADPLFSRAGAQRPDAAVLNESSRNPFIMLNMDPPEHTRIRRLVVRAFTTGAVEAMRARTQEIVDQLIDDMVASGPPVDFVSSFAVALPGQVVSEMLGVPRKDHDLIRGWLDITLSINAHPLEVVQTTHGLLFDYFTGLVAAKRAEPADDLVSRLIAAREEGASLSEQELVNTIFVLIAGGYETTATLLTNSLLILQHNLDQLSAVRARPELVPVAVEEFLRCVPIAWSTLERIATVDTELSGVPIPAGSSVIPLTYSANQDETLVSDPYRMDVTRTPAAHVTFGHGVHRCIGAPLAKLELETAYVTLFRRLPALRPAVPETDLEWKAGLLTVGPTTLPVTW